MVLPFIRTNRSGDDTGGFDMPGKEIASKAANRSVDIRSARRSGGLPGINPGKWHTSHGNGLKNVQYRVHHGPPHRLVHYDAGVGRVRPGSDLGRSSHRR